MATPQEKLADSLDSLKALQSDGRRVLRSSEIGRVHRERLVQNGFLREVIKGWLVSTGPHSTDGDTTPWYASFWEFCALYGRQRFGTQWHLSPEQSLLLHAEATAIPPQVVIYSPKARTTPSNCCSAPRSTTSNRSRYRRHRTSPKSRACGCMRPRPDEIVRTMKAAGYDVRENDPFAPAQHVPVIVPGVAPIVSRLHVIWEAQRQPVIDTFLAAPGLPSDRAAYLKFVDDIYENDAYHSLSIEGYSVTPELIDRVRQGAWNPQENEADRKNRDALAARGYWQAFQQVKNSVAAIIDGAQPGALVRDTHREWYRELFQPSVAAGLLRADALAGYRNQPVYIRGSRHVPARAEAVPEAMAALFDMLQNEPEPAVRAVLGHWLIGYIHPYPDGNGRMARFLMNAMLASGGYSWTVVRVEDRSVYMAALETVSVEMDIRPFAAFLGERGTLVDGTGG